jgi:hypothetical protein
MGASTCTVPYSISSSTTSRILKKSVVGAVGLNVLGYPVNAPLSDSFSAFGSSSQMALKSGSK